MSEEILTEQELRIIKRVDPLRFMQGYLAKVKAEDRLEFSRLFMEIEESFLKQRD